MDQNKELLKYLYQTTSMGLNSTQYLLNALQKKDNKIKKAIEDELTEYDSLKKKIEEKLKKLKQEVSEISLMKNMMSYMGINMEVLKDNSDTKIADMLIQGLTMGVLETEKHIKSFESTAEKDILKLAKDLLEFQKNSIEKLKTFL